jgi:hypothetical protein
MKNLPERQIKDHLQRNLFETYFEDITIASTVEAA